jgi:hypothetical protein
MTDHEELADQREAEADEMEQETDRLDQQVDDAKGKVKDMYNDPVIAEPGGFGTDDGTESPDGAVDESETDDPAKD